MNKIKKKSREDSLYIKNRFYRKSLQKNCVSPRSHPWVISLEIMLYVLASPIQRDHMISEIDLVV